MKKIFLRISVLLLLTLPLSCGTKKLSPLEEALEKAGNNRVEMEKVLHHFSAKNDTLGYKAARFLIENMAGKGYMVFSLFDTSESEVEFNSLDYPDYKTMVAAWDTIEAKRGELSFGKKRFADDLKEIKHPF